MTRYPAIQYLRGFAAIVVVIYHVLGQLADNLGHVTVLADYDLGARGVGLFFVLSGFIIVTAHVKELGRPEFLGRFLYKRATRILPFTFLAATGWLVIATIAHRIGIDAPGGTFFNWLNSAFILPFDRPQPFVIWSLRHEFLFYLLVSLAFINVRFFGALFAVWMASTVLIPSSDPFSANSVKEIVLWTILSPINLLFAFGLISAILVQRMGRIAHSNLWFLISLIGLILVGSVLGKSKYEIGPTILFGIACSASVIFAARAGGNIRWKTGELLGDASFAIYLLHPLLMPLLGRALMRVTTDFLVLFVAEVAVMVAAGVLTYLVIERPVMAWFRMRPATIPTRAGLRR